jgi:N-acetylmuramoyl-L-alanine amidase
MRRLLLCLLLCARLLPGDDPFPSAAPPSEEPADYAVPLLDGAGRLIWSGRSDASLRQRLWAEVDPDRRAIDILWTAAGAALAGPDRSESARGLVRALPEGVVVDETRVRGDQGGFFITLPSECLRNFDAERAQFLSDLFLGLSRAVPTVTRHVLEIRDPADGRHHPLDHFLPPAPPVPQKESELESPAAFRATGQPPAGGQGQPAGFLSGKSVFINPGHGWYYSSSAGGWVTQRGLGHYMIEDHSNAEAVLTYLTHYLWNAGAGVYTCRERDMTASMAILDNGGTGYSETGAWTTVTHASAYGGSYRRALVSGTESASATFVPTVPSAGFYNVYYWFRGTSENATDVKITIRHTGGSTVVTLNQARDGATWKDLGRYHFAAGSSPSSGAVVVSNQSAQAGHYVAADAVRLGGGTGTQTPFGEPEASGKPRFEEAGPYHAHFMGCPSATCGSSTVNAMPRYAAWENESWEDPIYISWHSNAYDGTSRGTSSFAYASGGWDAPFNGVAGGLELRNAVHNELIADLRAGFDASWANRGVHTNWYGEINPSNNPEMPGALFEMAYHDNAADAACLRNPVFRQIVARAVYQGIVKYYAGRDGVSYTLLPEPPVNLRVRHNGGGGVVAAWDAPPFSSHEGLYGDAATGYKVYRSTDGLGFDNGTAVTGTSYTDASVAAGTVYYYRVTATNAGGESFPTETLAVRIGSGPPVLVVAGFDRMDQNLALVTTDPQTGGTLHRGAVDRMNSYRYILRHAASLAAAGYAFDSASNEAVRSGEVPLGGYCAVDWFLGEESTADDTFDAAEQALAQAYLNGGGALFVSGAEIGWDLDYSGGGAAFYNGYLKADYAGDDAGTYAVTASAGGIFEGLAGFAFDDASSGQYDTNYPDQLTPLGGAAACLAYSGGLGGTAGIQYSGAFKVVHLGFPFEMITSSAARDAVMDRAMDYLTAGCAADGVAPAPVGDTLRWNHALGRWEWNPVTLDRLGGPETVAHYRVRRSTDPAAQGAVLAEPVSAYCADASVPPAGACWFYQVTAVDAAGNEGEPLQYSIQDNPQAVFTGTWSTGWVTAGHWGADYRYIATGGTGANTAVWRFTCREPGDYTVSVYYPSGGNRSTASRFTVAHAGGSTLYTINQQVAGGTWVPLGTTHRLNAGATYTVTLDDAEPAGFVVLADAVRWLK